MARRSQRLSSGSKVVPSPSHKRAASNTASPNAKAKRSKTTKATTTKSQYFKDPKGKGQSKVSEDDEDVEESSSMDDDESDFGDEADDLSSSDAEEGDDYDDESDEAPKSRMKATPGKGSKSSPAIRTKGGEMWREGVKAGLGPGTQMVIKKPQARAAGKTPYQDDRIHPNTLLFLKDLKQNNDRQWLKMHDPDFRQSERDWHSFVAQLTEKLTEIDDTVPELPVKDVIFRIYRDVRFSPDPTPYKPHFSAAWSRTGRKGPYAHYYVQISPDNQSFVGGGLYHPEAAPMAAIRQNIDSNPRRIKAVLVDEKMRKEFLGGISKNEAKAVDAFVKSNAENALKTKPKGYDADHAEIDLLRLRNYTVGKKLTEQEVVGKGGLERIAYLLGCMKPLITYLNSVVMPDEADEESEDSPDEESGQENENEDDE